MAKKSLKKSSKTSPGSLSLLIETGLDQGSRRPDAKLVLNEVESIVLYAKKEGSPDLAVSFLARIDNAINLGGKALGYALFLTQKEFFPNDTEAFFETVFAKVGKAPDTVRKYLRVGEAIQHLIDNTAPDVQQKWLDRPVQDLIALGQALAEHGEFSLRQLKKLSDTADNATLRQEIQKIVRGDDGEDSNVIMLTIGADGVVVAHQGEEYEEIGHLEADGELGKKALARIKRRAGLKDK